jgi:hypothetical protein
VSKQVPVEQVVIDKMNDLFGAESFSASQVREFVQGLVQRLLAYPNLVNQTKVNSKKQFVESQDFQAAVTEAVVDNQEAHNTMADYFCFQNAVRASRDSHLGFSVTRVPPLMTVAVAS